MTNKEKFMSLVSEKKTDTVAKNKERIRNRAMLRESQQIALKVLFKLDELGWSQVYLAEKLNVKPQQVNRMLRGKENLSLETQVKLQEVLDIPILASYYEKQLKVLDDLIITFKNSFEYSAPELIASNYLSGKVIKLKPDVLTYQCSFEETI